MKKSINNSNEEIPISKEFGLKKGHDVEIGVVEINNPKLNIIKNQMKYLIIIPKKRKKIHLYLMLKLSKRTKNYLIILERIISGKKFINMNIVEMKKN